MIKNNMSNHMNDFNDATVSENITAGPDRAEYITEDLTGDSNENRTENLTGDTTAVSNKKNKTELTVISNILLLITAIIWGIAFVAQSVGMKYVGPWTFVFTRFLIAGILLIPVVRFSQRNNKADSDSRTKSSDERENVSRETLNENTTINKSIAADSDVSRETSEKKAYKIDLDSVRKTNNTRITLLAGIVCGLFLGLASIAQQVGIQHTTVGKAGFITALYVIIVPILGIIVGKKLGKKIVLCALLAIIGFYFLCIKESLHITQGDSFVMLCALLFSLQIMSVDYFTERCNPVSIACLEFFVASFVGLVGMLLFEQFSFESIKAAAYPILYAGVLSSAVGYTLQIVAQKNTNPAVASLLMSLESVFSALAGWVLLHQTLSGRELLGCVLVFVAVIIAQMPVEKLLSRVGSTKSGDVCMANESNEK